MTLMTNTNKRFANYVDDSGNHCVLEGESGEELASQLPADYDGPNLAVTEESGFYRGWIGGNGFWSAH